jgi:hypothetical protein
MSTPDEELIALIHRAAAATGSEYKLAKAMGIPQQHVSNWKAGTRACVPADRARLAGFAREDAIQELIRATLKQTEGTLRGEQLRRLLGKPFQVTGAAIASGLLAVISSICLMWPTDGLLYTMYRKVKS